MNDQYEAVLGGIIIVIVIAFLLSFSHLLFGFALPTLAYKPSIERYLWTFRGIDILAQIFIIFAASTAVAALLRKEKTIKKEKVGRKAKFEIYKDAKGEFRFRLRAPNNEIIAVSEAYTSKSACLNGVSSVRTNASIAPVEEIVEVK